MSELQSYLASKGYKVKSNCNYLTMAPKATAIITKDGVSGGLFFTYEELRKILEFGPGLPKGETLVVYI